MHKPLMLLTIGATLGALAAPAFAMSEGEYRSEKDRLAQAYSAERVNCDSLSGAAKRDCDAKIREQKKIAEDKLEASYKESGAGRGESRKP